MTPLDLLVETSVPAWMAAVVAVWARAGDHLLAWPSATLVAGLGNFGLGSVVDLLHDSVAGRWHDTVDGGGP